MIELAKDRPKPQTGGPIVRYNLRSANPDRHSTPNAKPYPNLNFEPAIERLGDDYFDLVPAAEFPAHFLRWRNDPVFAQLGLDPSTIADTDVIAAFGKFQGRSPFLALRYHGYQFGEYNSRLGDVLFRFASREEQGSIAEICMPSNYTSCDSQFGAPPRPC